MTRTAALEEAWAGDSEPARQLGRLLLASGYYGPPEGGPSTVGQPQARAIESPVRTHSQHALERPVELQPSRQVRAGTLSAKILAVLPTEAPGITAREIFDAIGGGQVSTVPSVCSTLSHLAGIARTGAWRSYRYYKVPA